MAEIGTGARLGIWAAALLLGVQTGESLGGSLEISAMPWPSSGLIASHHPATLTPLKSNKHFPVLIAPVKAEV